VLITDNSAPVKILWMKGAKNSHFDRITVI